MIGAKKSNLKNCCLLFVVNYVTFFVVRALTLSIVVSPLSFSSIIFFSLHLSRAHLIFVSYSYFLFASFQFNVLIDAVVSTAAANAGPFRAKRRQE